MDTVLKKNPKVAVEWYRKAADQGYLSAQKLLGTMYSKGSEIPKDYLLAVHYYLLASEKGDENAKDTLSKADYQYYLSSYMSYNWPKIHMKLHKDIRNAIMGMVFVLNDRKQGDSYHIPKELWWLICRGVIGVWPHNPLYGPKIENSFSKRKEGILLVGLVRMDFF